MISLDLVELGFRPFFASRFDQLEQPELVPARVAADGRGIYPLLGCRAPLGELAGRLRHALGPQSRPAVGDWVAVADHGDRAIIHDILERRTVLVRRAAFTESEGQVIAANVDLFAVVTSANRELNPRRIERYLTAVWDSGATPLIVLNKIDLVADLTPALEAVREVALGVPILPVSAETGEGIAALREQIGPGTTVGLIGSSGVGKSSLINRLLGRESQQVNAVRDDDARGRHTTTRRELIPLAAGGVLIDTPGMRELGLIEDSGGVGATFADIEETAAQCRFANCQHEAEPGCALREALAGGAISRERWDSYRKLQREIAAAERRRDPELAADERRKWKTIPKAMRTHSRVTGKP